MKSPEKTLRAVATMKPVTMAIVRKDGAVDTVWSSQMAVIAPSFDGIDRRRPNLNKRLAVSRSRAGGGIMMMMWLLNFQENSADMVWWLSSLLSHALPDKNSSLDDSEKNAPDQGEHTWTTWKKNSNGSRCQSKALLMRLISIAPDFNMLCWMHSTPPALLHVPIARVHE